MFDVCVCARPDRFAALEVEVNGAADAELLVAVNIEAEDGERDVGRPLDIPNEPVVVVPHVVLDEDESDDAEEVVNGAGFSSLSSVWRPPSCASRDVSSPIPERILKRLTSSITLSIDNSRNCSLITAACSNSTFNCAVIFGISSVVPVLLNSSLSMFSALMCCTMFVYLFSSSSRLEVTSSILEPVSLRSIKHLTRIGSLVPGAEKMEAGLSRGSVPQSAHNDSRRLLNATMARCLLASVRRGESSPVSEVVEAEV
jgi:hypothetical protein